jgi:hypothetical protein
MHTVHVTVVDRCMWDTGVVAKQPSFVDDEEVVHILPVAHCAKLLAVGVIDPHACRTLCASRACRGVQNLTISLLIHPSHPFFLSRAACASGSGSTHAPYDLSLTDERSAYYLSFGHEVLASRPQLRHPCALVMSQHFGGGDHARQVTGQFSALITCLDDTGLQGYTVYGMPVIGHRARP